MDILYVGNQSDKFTYAKSLINKWLVYQSEPVHKVGGCSLSAGNKFPQVLISCHHTELTPGIQVSVA